MKTRALWVSVGLLLVLCTAVSFGGGTQEAKATNKYLPEKAEKVVWAKSNFIPGLEVPVNLKKKVYYIESFMEDVLHLMFVAGVKRCALQMGWGCEVLNPENNLQLQVKMIEDALAKGDMDGLILNAVDSEGVASAVQKVNEAGIPVTIVDRWPSGGKVLFGSGGDWFQHANDATNYMIKLLKEKYGEPKGKVIAMIIGMEIDPLRDRRTKLREIMKNFPNIEVIEKSAPMDPVKDAQILKDAVLANPDVDAIWNIADVFGMNYVATLNEIGMLYPAGHPKHIIIVSHDGTDWAFDEIRRGNFDCTMASQLFEWGYVATWAMGQYYGGRAGKTLKAGQLFAPGASIDGSEIIAKENGLYCKMTSFLVTKDNIDDPKLGGNRVAEAKEWARK